MTTSSTDRQTHRPACPSPPTRRNLVVLRAGDRSFHPHWLGPQPRSFDLALSYYGKLTDPYPGQFDFLHRYQGSKWEGLVDFFRTHSALADQYERIWLPDDDLLTDTGTINQLFTLAEEYAFDLCQPALTLYSHASHKITLRHPFCRARETDFVEVMAPCFSTATLRAMVDSFALCSSGWGLEWVWYDRARKSGLRLGIIDAAAVFHTRPQGTAGQGGAANPYLDRARVLRDHNLRMTRPRNFALYPVSPAAHLFHPLVNRFLNRLVLALGRW